MQVSPVKSQFDNNMTFNGKFIQKGKWPGIIRNALKNQETISNLSSCYDVVARLSTRRAWINDKFHKPGQKLYKIKFSFLQEDSKLDKFLDFFHLKKRYSLTKHYHSAHGTESCIDDAHFDRLITRNGL